MNKYMKKSSDLANKGIEKKEGGPFGAVIVDKEGKIISTGNNCEPCPMCLSAIIWANIKNVYYGCTRKDAGEIGFRDDMIYEYLKGKNKKLINIKQIDREECLKIMKKYKEIDGKIY